MVKEKYIELKIKLKSIKKPIIAELPNYEFVDKFLNALKCDGPIVRFGQIMFYKNEFIYAEYIDKMKINIFKKEKNK